MLFIRSDQSGETALGNEEETLASAYREKPAVSAQYDLKTVAFPSVSTGAYGFPLDKAAPIAISTAQEFLRDDSSIEEIRFVLFDAFALQRVSKACAAMRCRCFFTDAWLRSLGGRGSPPPGGLPPRCAEWFAWRFVALAFAHGQIANDLTE